MNHLAIACVVLSSSGLAAQAPVKVIEDGALDKIVLHAKSIEAPAQLIVGVRLFTASDADLGTGAKDGKDTRQQEAKKIQAEGPRMLAEQVVAALAGGPFKSARILNEGEQVADALIVEGKFVEIDPGSRAKRYLVGYGAGKSAVKVTGTVKDSSGKLLASFEQRRVGAMGIGGGDSLDKLTADSKAIGEDIGKFLTKWARGQKLE